MSKKEKGNRKMSANEVAARKPKSGKQAQAARREKKAAKK
jgi:hypothetical protein